METPPDDELLRSAKALCADENLIVKPTVEQFIRDLGPEEIRVLASLYDSHRERLHALALDIEEGRLRDPALWRVICVLRDLDRLGRAPFAGARLMGRRRLDATSPQTVRVEWLPERFARYLPVFQAVIFADANDLDVQTLIPADEWGLPRTPQWMFDALGTFQDECEDPYRRTIALDVSLVLDGIG
jgi:hypothetical protein